LRIRLPAHRRIFQLVTLTGEMTRYCRTIGDVLILLKSLQLVVSYRRRFAALAGFHGFHVITVAGDVRLRAAVRLLDNLKSKSKTCMPEEAVVTVLQRSFRAGQVVPKFTFAYHFHLSHCA
jgi:hypothetical protein